MSKQNYSEIEEDVRQGILEAIPILAEKRGWKREELEEFASTMFGRPLTDCSSRELAAMIAHFRDYHSIKEGDAHNGAASA